MVVTCLTFMDGSQCMYTLILGQEEFEEREIKMKNTESLQKFSSLSGNSLAYVNLDGDLGQRLQKI